ncbi:MAG: glutathione peroxidase [Deltaproteobacteria bacterium]|nr:glutathione peroxidase [Deltaproteobacteria bacterium]
MKLSIILVATLAAACSKDTPETQAPEPVEPAASTPASASAEVSATAAGDAGIFAASIRRLGEKQKTTLAEHKGKALLIVNVASKCGLTNQYEGLEAMYEKYRDKGLVVLGFPSNQFGGQEPGSAEEIKAFCRTTYGIKFPMYEKIEVNGPGRHPIYAELVKTQDADGQAGDVKWNFEKFLVSADGKTVKRFRSRTAPGDQELVAAVEAALP